MEAGKIQDVGLHIPYSERMNPCVERSQLPAILVLDDNVPMLELFTRTLSPDHCVFACSSLQAAAHILSTEEVHLVIFEPMVAGPYGWELLKRMTREYAVPVVVCSTLDDRAAGLASGATAYLVKPVSPTLLRGVLKSILG